MSLLKFLMRCSLCCNFLLPSCLPFLFVFGHFPFPVFHFFIFVSPLLSSALLCSALLSSPLLSSPLLSSPVLFSSCFSSFNLNLFSFVRSTISLSISLSIYFKTAFILIVIFVPCLETSLIIQARCLPTNRLFLGSAN